MPCSGRCDEPIPVLTAHTTLAGESAATLKPTPSPLLPANSSGNEEALFSNIWKQGHNTLEGYQNNGGFKALESSPKEGPIHVIEIVTKSKLAGRGGAGFPTGLKWKSVA